MNSTTILILVTAGIIHKALIDLFRIANYQSFSITQSVNAVIEPQSLTFLWLLTHLVIPNAINVTISEITGILQ